MKIRRGWVSNSSSSSFIVDLNSLISSNIDIEWGDKDAPEKILKDFRAMLKRWKTNNIKNFKKRYRNTTLYNYTEEKLQEAYEKHKEYMENRYCDAFLQQELQLVKLTEEEKEDLSYWYPKNALMGDIICIQGSENYIPETIASKFIKKYDVRHYCLHMG